MVDWALLPWYGNWSETVLCCILLMTEGWDQYIVKGRLDKGKKDKPCVISQVSEIMSLQFKNQWQKILSIGFRNCHVTY